LGLKKYQRHDYQKSWRVAVEARRVAGGAWRVARSGTRRRVRAEIISAMIIRNRGA
jgi:hypothetical protein